MVLTKEEILEALKQVYDPEIPVDIVNLGLVYEVSVVAGRVDVKLTTTSPGCPVGDFIARQAERVIRGMNGVEDARAELVDDPPWSPALMSVEGRRMLGWK